MTVSLGSGLVPTTLLAAVAASKPVASATVTNTCQAVCDTGEPLSDRVIKLLHSLDYVELHEFLLAPLLCAVVAEGLQNCKRCATKEKDKWMPKMVSDMYTWLPCFHQFVAAAASVHPTMTSQFMAYANTIQHEGDGWRAYDRAFRLKVAGRA